MTNKYLSLKMFRVALVIAVLFTALTASGQLTYYSKAAATDFNALATWGINTDGTGASPASITNADNYIVANSAALTLTGNASVRQLAINSGSLTVSANTLTVSIASANNTTFTLGGGTLTISGGTLNVNGNVALTSGTFNMSSGNFNVDGNSNASGTSVAVGTPIFNAAISAGTVDGGTITIVDPHFGAATATTFQYNVSSTAASWVGNTLRFGNGTSTDASSATSGFHFDCYFSTGRLTLGDVVVNGGSATNRFASSATSTSDGTFVTNLTINATSELRTAGNGIWVAGNITNNGILTNATGTVFLAAAGSTTAPPASTVTQTISGTGTYRNNAVSASSLANFTNLFINNTNATGVTFSNQNSLVCATGVTNTGTVSGTLTLVAGLVNIGAANTFILGTTTASFGTFTYTAGGFTNGTFARWYSATFTASTITASTDPSAITSRYPFTAANASPSATANRSFYILKSSGTISAGGTVGIKYVDASTLTVPGTSIVDATPAYTVNLRHDANWSVVTGGGFNTGTGVYTIATVAPGLFATTNAAAPRLVPANGPGVVGAYQGGTVTPGAQRITLSMTQLTAQPWYMGLNQNDFTYQTIATGNWSSTSTWLAGLVPTSTNNAIISAGNNVTVDIAGAACNSLTIAATGALTLNNAANALAITATTATTGITNNGTIALSNGTLTMGAAGGGIGLFTNASGGALNVSGGTFNINGQSIIASGSSFSQSGGQIDVDPNSGTAGTSVASGTNVFSIGTSIANYSTGAISLTGGTFRLRDIPNAGAGIAFAYFGSSAQNFTASTSHTFRIGDGTAGSTTTSTSGFLVNGMNVTSGGRLVLGTVIVDGFNTTRFATPGSSSINRFYATDLTINAGAELRTTAFGGEARITRNLANNGTLTTFENSTFTLGGVSGNADAASTNAQTVTTSSGVFRNNTTGSTGNFGALGINNSNASGVTFSIGSFSVTATWTQTAGSVFIGSTNTLTMGTTTQTGTVTWTAGGVADGFIARNVPSATVISTAGAGLFPFTNGTDVRNATIGLTAGATTAGTITIKHNNVAGSTGVSFTDASGSPNVGIADRGNSNWSVFATTLGYTGTLGTLSLRADNSVTVTTFANVRAVGASAAAAGVSAAGTGSITNPVANKTTMAIADWGTSGSPKVLYIGQPRYIVSNVPTGNWSSASSWLPAVVPTAGDIVTILAGHTITVDVTSVANDLTINATGGLVNSANTLTITNNIANSGTVTLSGTGTITHGLTNGGNATFTNASGGTLTVSGGTLNTNGNMLIANGSNFTQSGGNINIDGNSGSAGTSVAAGTDLFSIGTTGTAYNTTTGTTLVFSGGTFTIVDPQFNTTGNAFRYQATGSLNTNCSTSHTFRFGDGVSSTAGGTIAFNHTTFPSSGRFAFGNLDINGPTGINRFVTNTFEYGVLGNLTINAGGELRATANYLHVAGNITVNGDGTSTVANNGILTSSNTIYLDTWSGSGTSLPTANAQTIGGSGYFTNNTTASASTANFTGLSINNTNATGVTFANANSLTSVISGLYTNTGTISGGTNGLLLVAGKINLGANTFTFGTAGATPSALTYTAGGFVGGSIKRWINTSIFALPAAGLASSSGTFPFITSTGVNRMLHLALTTAGTAGSVTVTYNDVAGTTNIGPYADGVTVGKRINSNWVVSNVTGLTSASFSMRLRGDGVPVILATDARISFVSGIATGGTSASSVGTLTTPEALQTARTTANLANTYYFATPANVQSVQTGNWNQTTTWDCGCVPTSSSVVFINSGHNVSLATATDVASTLTINSGGTLTGTAGNTLTTTTTLTNNGTLSAAAGTITVGTTITNGGTINVSGGTLNAIATTAAITQNTGSVINISAGTFNFGPAGGYNLACPVATGNTLSISGTGTFNVNGNVVMTGGTFTMTGGNFNIDGNSGVVGTSVASGTDLFVVPTSMTQTVNGGIITIVDPPYAGSGRAFANGFSTSGINWAGNTLRLGGTTGTNITTSTTGFMLDCYVGTSPGRGLLGTVEANGGNTSDRFALITTATGNGVFMNNLVINAGSEMRQTTATAFFVAGNITNNGTLTVTNTLTLGSLSAGLTSASTLTQAISGTGVFRNATSGSTASFASLTVNNTNATGVSLGSITGSALSVSGALTLTAGKIDLGANTLTLGISAGTPGSLNYTAGGFTGGTFARYFATGAISLASTMGASGFPFITSAGVDRTAYFGVASLATGGLISVKYTDATGTSLLTTGITDGTNLDSRSNAYWTVTGNTYGFAATGGTGSLRFQAAGLYGSIQNFVNVRMIPVDGPALAPGNSGSGTGSNAAPAGNKTGLLAADLPVAGTNYYFSSPTSIVSAQTGPWNTASSWSPAIVPTSTDNVTILNTHNITLDAPGGAAASLTINTGGTLTANANTLAVTGNITNVGTIALGGATITNGATGGGNAAFTISSGGALNVSSGTLTVNGRFVHSAGATFTQSGGAIAVDGNAAGVTASSVAAGSALVSISRTSASPGTITLTGGTFTIVDPHADPAGTGSFSFGSDITTQNVNAGVGHTFIFGDPTSTDAGGNAFGMRINPYNGGQSLFAFGKVIVNGTLANNREVTIFNSRFAVLSDLTVDNGGYFDGSYTNSTGATIYVNGNITVNTGSTFITPLAANALVLGNFSSNTLTASANNQIITVNGTGSIANATTSPTANFNSLTINNTNATGVSIASLNSVGTGTVAGTLTNTAGIVDLNGGTFTLGTTIAAPGTLSFTAGGFIDGTLTRYFGTGAITMPTAATGMFPFVSAAGTENRSAWIATSGAITGGTVSINYADASGTTSMTTVTDGVYTAKLRSNASWTVSNSIALGASTALLRIQGGGITTVDPTQTILTDNGVVANGTSVAGTGTSPNSQGNKTAFAAGTLSGTFYVATPRNIVSNVASGNWSNTGSWLPAVNPGLGDVVTILTGHNISTDGANAATSLTINSGGTLTAGTGTLDVPSLLTNNGTIAVSGGALNYGPTGGGNKTFTVGTGSTLNISSGTFYVAGNVAMTAGTFTMSGGNLNIDGNDGTTGGSVASGTDLLNVTLATALTQSVTGGTITIVDPPYAGTGLAFSTASSGNNPTWSGSTLRLGGSTGTNATTATVGYKIDTYAGFGRLQLGTVEVNGGGNDAARITTTSAATGNATDMTNLVINANSEFRSIAATNITIAGNITNNGTLTTQSGHTLTLAGLSGTSIAASTLTQTISGTGTFRDALTSPLASFANLTVNNTNATGVTIGTDNLNVSGTLTLTAGKIKIGPTGNFTFALGTSNTSSGILSYTAGGITAGTFKRWYTSTAVTIGNVAGRYPFITTTGTTDRSAYFGTSGATSGGFVSVKYNDASGVNAVTSFTDFGAGISSVSAASWVTSNTFAFGASTGLFRLQGNGIFTGLANFADVRITGATASALGTSALGTGSNANPQGNKTTLAAADLNNQTLYLGAPRVINSLVSGNWSDVTPGAETWDCLCVPSAGDIVIINSGHNVSLDATTNVAGSLTINSGGTLTGTASNTLAITSLLSNSGTIAANAGTITIGTSLTNAASSTINAGGGTINVGTTIANSGTINLSASGTINATAATAAFTTVSGSLLNVSGGTLNYGPSGGYNRVLNFVSGATFTTSSGNANVNGSLIFNSGSTFNQSGGTIKVDGNAGGVLANSITATPIIQFLGTGINLTGGTLICVDPSANTTATLTIQYNNSTSNVTATGTHTLQLGDGVSTDAGGNATNQFRVDLYTSSNRFNLRNLVINLPAGTNRAVTQQYSQGCNGDLTIAAGELIITPFFFVGGNISNSGTLTTTGTLYLGSSTTTTSGGTTAAQTISGSGTFRDIVASPTASFNNLTINNTNATGVTINVNNLKVFNSLTFTAGKVALGTNTLALGTSPTNIGVLSYTAGGFVSGKFTRWYGTAAETVGNLSNSYPFISAISGTDERFGYFGTNGVTSGGSVTIGYNDGSGFNVIGTPFTDLGVDVIKVSNANWTVSHTMTLGASTGELSFEGQGIFGTTLPNFTDIRITGATAAAPGTSMVGDGTATYPYGNKVAMSSTDLTGTFYVGIPSVIGTAQSGLWSAPSTWVGGFVPTSSDQALINPLHAVTLDVSSSASGVTISSTGSLTVAANTLTLTGSINNSGTLTVSGGTITQGAAGGGNAAMASNSGATYTVSAGGTHNINGRLTILGGTFNHTGGNIVVDGNANNVAASSVAGTPIVYLGAATYSLTGGTITIVDPHVDGANFETFRYDNTVNYNAGAGHTVQFGNGSSTTPGLTADGFLFETYFGTAYLQFGNIIVNSGSGTNRHVQTNYNYGMSGSLTVTSGQYRSNAWDTYINGNLTVNSGASIVADDYINMANFANYTISASTNAQTISGAGTFYDVVGGTAGRISNLYFNNTNATGITISTNLTVSGTLVFVAGKVALGSNVLTLGTSAAAPGTLSYTAGGFTSGSFNRWYGTATVAIGNVAGRYPFISGTDDRSAFFATSGNINGGTVGVKYNDAAGVTNLGTPFNDGGVGVAKYSNAYWTVSQAMDLASSTGFFRLRGNNITTVTDFTTTRIITSTGAVGGTSTAGTGSNTAPEGNKAGMTSANYTGDMRIGYPSYIIAVANGPWHIASTWDCNCVPGAGSNATIPSPYTVTVTQTSVGATLTINSGGGLTIAANNLLTLGGNLTNNGTYFQSNGFVTIGTSGGGNPAFTNPSGSSFTVSGGTLNVNGRLNTLGSQFNQSGGVINIDGNSGTAASSVAEATDLCYIGATTINCSGGTLRIIDPPHSSYVTTTRSLVINSASSTTAFSGSHTVEFGNGVSTTQGYPGGFVIETLNSGRVPLRNVTVNAGSNFGRWVSGSYSAGTFGTHILGTLTINSGSEVRTNTVANEFAISGDLVNNGTLTAEKTITLGSSTYTVTTPQTISGTGVFRNLTIAPTANYTSLTVNNSGGVTFGSTPSISGTGTGTVSGTLTMTLGNITLPSATFTLGTAATAPGTLSYTAGFITGGSFSRWIGTSAITIPAVAGRFPFGSGTNDRSFYVGTSAAIVTGGTITVNYTDVASTTALTPFSDGGSTVTDRSNASWAVTQSGLDLGTSTLLTRIQGNGVGTVTDFTSCRTVLASASAPGTSVNGTGSNTLPATNKTTVTAANIANTYYFGIGSITCPPPTAQTATGITTISANLGWTAGGTETAWDVEVMLSSASPTGTPTASGVTNPYPLGGLSAATSYKYYVRAACGGTNGNSIWVGPFTFSTLVGTSTNDVITSAINLTLNNVAAFATYNNIGSTTDALPSVTGSCQSNINSDVWFKTTANALGTVAIYFRSGSAGTPLTDMVVHAYTSSDNTPTGTLTEVGCNDDGGPTNLPFAYISGLAANTVVYIRASDYDVVNQGTFDIAVTPYHQWTGASSTTFTTGANWLSTDLAPSATTDNICIPNGLSTYPTNSAGQGITNILMLNGAVLTNSGGNLTVRGNITGPATGTPAQFAGTNFVVLNGTGAQTISGNNTVFTRLRVNKASGTATVATGSNMQIITAILDLPQGTLVANGNITIQSTALTQAYIDDFSTGNTGTVTGNVKVERFITQAQGQNGFRYVGAPVNTGGGAMNLSGLTGFTASGTSGYIIPLPTCDPNNVALGSPYGNLMRWDENGNSGTFLYNCRQAGWFFFTSGSFTSGRGYGVKVSSGNKLTYTGTANTGNINYACTNSNIFTPASQNGWNLVSNPYPSTITISNTDANVNNNMPTGFDGQIQTYLTSGPLTGTYQSFNVGTSSASFALGQGFWVRVSNPGSATWSMTNNYRVTSNATYYDVNSPVEEHLKVEVAGNNFMDQTDINFVADAQVGFDFYDANKWMSANGQPTLYTTVGGEMLSINSIPSLTNTALVPMGFNPGANGDFTLTFSDIATFPASAMIQLEDLKLGTMTDLRVNNIYTFSSSANDATDRFVIHFQPGVTTAVVDANCDSLGSIEFTQPGTTVWDTYTVKDNADSLYAQGTNYTGTITLNNLQPQEYIITLTHSTGYVAQEFITVNGFVNTINSTVDASATDVNVNELVTLTGSATDAADYSWNFGDNTNETGTTMTQHAYTAPGTYTVTFTASNSNCSSAAVKTINVTTPTGITNTKADGLTIYGAGNHVVIEFNNWGADEADIFMYNAVGQRVETLTGVSTLKGRQEINIADIKPGYYFIQVSSEGKIESKKVFLGSN